MLNEGWGSNAPPPISPFVHTCFSIYGHCILLFEQSENVSIDSAYLQVFDLMCKSTRRPDRGQCFSIPLFSRPPRILNYIVLKRLRGAACTAHGTSVARSNLDKIGNVHWHLFDLGVVKLLDIAQVSNIPGGDEVDCNPFTAETTRPTKSVNVVFTVRWQILVDNNTNLLHIDTSRQ